MAFIDQPSIAVIVSIDQRRYFGVLVPRNRLYLFLKWQMLIRL